MIPFAKRYVKKRPATIQIPPPPPPPPIGSDKYLSGYVTKLERWQIYNSNGTLKTASIDEIFEELRTTPALLGIKLVIEWGDIDKGGNTSNWNLLVINNLVQRLHALRQETPSKKKHLLIAISFIGTITDIIPVDLQTTGGYTPSKAGYTARLYAWPYGSGSVAPTGFSPKLWDAVVANRFNSFCQKLANYVVPNTDGKTLDAGDYLYMMSTLESVVQPLYDSAFPGHTTTKYEDGVLEAVKSMKANFQNTMVSICLNYTKPLLTRTIPQLAALKIGINTPNSNYASGLIIGGTNPGILNYFQNPTYADSLVLSPEIQGDDYFSTVGKDARDAAKAAAAENPPDWTAVDAAYDFPSYITLHRRCRDDLNAHIIVAQRTFPFWLGGVYKEAFTTPSGIVNHTFPGTRPSFLQFLKTNAEVIADVENGFSPRPTDWL